MTTTTLGNELAKRQLSWKACVLQCQTFKSQLRQQYGQHLIGVPAGKQKRLDALSAREDAASEDGRLTFIVNDRYAWVDHAAQGYTVRMCGDDEDRNRLAGLLNDSLSECD